VLDRIVPTSSVDLDNGSTMLVTAGAQSMSTETRMHAAVRVKPGK
jgi:hypothetical protein